jgi:D-alanine-D-alanine ligase
MLMAEIVYVQTMSDFMQALGKRSFDIVWSALYHISPREDIIGIGGDVDWIADVMDDHGVPYIGPSSRTMKNLIQKYQTHRILGENGIPVPVHQLVAPGQQIPSTTFPAFVKPNCESRSIGIGDESVVNNSQELLDRVKYVHREFKQDALIEEFLPGEEYTVLMLGNGRFQEILPGKVTVDEKYYGKHRILRSDLRGVGLTKISIPETRSEEAKSLCKRATDALECLDHVRVDMRVGSDGLLRVIEVNGIPGLKPVKSWSPQIYSLYHNSGKGHMEEYREMVHLIVRSALERHRLL